MKSDSMAAQWAESYATLCVMGESGVSTRASQHHGRLNLTV